MKQFIISFLTLITAFSGVDSLQTPTQAQDIPELLIRHRDAMGGAEKIMAIKGLHMTVHFSMMMLEGTVETYMVAPDKFWTNVDASVVKLTEATNGEIKWKMDSNGQITKSEDDSALAQPAMVLPDYQYLFPNPEITVKDLGKETIDGKEYLVLEVDAPGYKKSRKKYLDPETLLVVRENAEEEGITMIVEYSDYKEMEGIMVPAKTVQKPQIPGVPPSTLTLKTVTFTEEFDMNMFNPPEKEVKDYHFPPENMVTVPMKLHGEHLVVGVSINGKGPYDFILDSGAAATIMDKGFAQELGLEGEGGMHAIGVGGAEEIEKLDIKELAVGEFKIDELELYSMDMTLIAEMLGMKDTFKGIVGYDLFARAVMKLDYQKEELTIIDSETFQYDGPGKPVNGELINNLICVDGVIDGDIEGKIRIDTGAAGGVHLHSGYLREHGLYDRYKGDVEMDFFGAGGKQTIQLVKVKSLKLGEFEVVEPSATLLSSKEGEDGIMGTLDAAATIGTEVLSRFVVFFDYERNRLILEPTDALSKPAKMNRAGLILVQDEDVIMVGAVLSGSPAEEAGFKVGDEVIKLEKLKAGKGLTADIGNRMLYSEHATEFDFKVRREDTVLRLELKLRDLVN